MAIRMIIADDHRVILEGLEGLMRREGFDVVATATSGSQALEAVREHQPQILVLDMRMPDGDGLSVLRTLHEEKLPTRAILLTAELHEDEVLEAMRLGAAGLVLKESAAVLLVNCVRRVAHGERVFDEGMVSRALERMLKKQEAENLKDLLSPRETEIVKMVAAGLRNKEIAIELSIGEGTVKTHLHAIYEKLGVHGRVELAKFAYERGIV